MDAVELARPAPRRAAFGHLLEETGPDELGHMLAGCRVVDADVVGEGGNGDRRIGIEHERVDPVSGGISQGSRLRPDVVVLLRVPFGRSARFRHVITISGHRSAAADAIGESLTCHVIIYIIHSK